MAGFLTPLELEYIDGHLWEIKAPFEYRVGHEFSETMVVIPDGFITDFASVPRFLWPLLPPTGPYGKAAVVHDWLYQFPQLMIPEQPKTRVINRAEADSILNEAMEVLEVGKMIRWSIYSGVRVGGWKPWDWYREKDKL